MDEPMTNDELQHELDGQVWRQQKLTQEGDMLRAELERHRALVADLQDAAHPDHLRCTVGVCNRCYAVDVLTRHGFRSV